MGGNGEGGHCLVRMEWCPAGRSVCLLSASVNLPLHHKSRSSLVAPADLGGPRKKGREMVVCVCVCCWLEYKTDVTPATKSLDFDARQGVALQSRKCDRACRTL